MHVLGGQRTVVVQQFVWYNFCSGIDRYLMSAWRVRCTAFLYSNVLATIRGHAAVLRLGGNLQLAPC